MLGLALKVSVTRNNRLPSALSAGSSANENQFCDVWSKTRLFRTGIQMVGKFRTGLDVLRRFLLHLGSKDWGQFRGHLNSENEI